MSFEKSIPFENQENKGQTLELLDSNNQSKNKEDNNSYKNQNNNSKNIDFNFSDNNLDMIKIKELNSNSVEFIFEDKIDIALEILKKLESVLETNVIESKFDFDKKLIIIILHNLSCCYQKIKDYESCILYLDGVIYHFDKILEKKHKITINEDYFYNNMNKDQSDYSLLGDLILELRFSAKFHLQMCAALSQANRHIEALKHAKLAGLICEDNLIKTHYLFIQMKLQKIFSSGRNKINNEGEENDLDNILNDSEKMKLTQQLINDLFNKIINIKKQFYQNGNNSKFIDNDKNFDSYLKYRKNEIRQNEKNGILLNNIRNIFGNEVKKDDWIQLLNIGNIMYLSALNEEDLDLDSDPKYEILRDAILEKIVMLTVSYFCIAMEMNQLSKDKNNKKINGEFFLYNAVLFSEEYLPVSCPIVKHYINSYYKYYQKDLDIIPEGKILDYKIELIRNEIENGKDTQSFVKLKKINYSSNIPNNPISNLNINSNKNNNIMMKEINNNNNSLENQNIGNKKNKIPLGLKFNLNFADIINNNINNNLNNSENNNNNNISINKFNGPQNTRLTISNDSKIGSNSINKNTICMNENIQNGDNYHSFFNKNHININIAEKSKIKDLPKFKLNFNKINNIEREDNKIDIAKNFQSLSNKISQMKNNNIKKINTKISMNNKTNRHYSNGKKNNKNSLNKNGGYKTERPKSNKRPISNNNDTLIINNNENNGIELKRNSFYIPFYSNKYLSKTSRYNNKNEKSPIPNKKTKEKGNLTDRIVINNNNNNNNNKSLRKSNDSLINKMNHKNKSGYQTQRELANFKLKEIDKKNISININSGKRAKSPYYTNNGRKIKSSTKYNSNNINNNNNINNSNNIRHPKNNKSLNVNNKDNNNNIYKNNNKFSNILKNNKIFPINAKKNIIKNNNTNIFDNLYKNLLFGIKKNNGNFLDNYGKAIGYNKNGHKKNINTFIKIKNPFKI